jgi:hypothetical protein
MRIHQFVTEGMLAGFESTQRGASGMYRLIGGGLAFLGVVAVGAVNSADRSENYVPAEAEIFRIDRTCVFNTEKNGPKGTVKSQERDDCSSTGEFAKLRGDHDGKRMDVDGDAIVKISYTSPVDHSFQSAELKFTGRNEEFYKYNAHDKIRILVSKTDPKKILRD